MWGTGSPSLPRHRQAFRVAWMQHEPGKFVRAAKETHQNTRCRILASRRTQDIVPIGPMAENDLRGNRRVGKWQQIESQPSGIRAGDNRQDAERTKAPATPWRNADGSEPQTGPNGSAAHRHSEGTVTSRSARTHTRRTVGRVIAASGCGGIGPRIRGKPTAKACCSDARAQTERGRAGGGRELGHMSAKVMTGSERPTSGEERKKRAPKMSGTVGGYEKVCDKPPWNSPLSFVT